LIRAIVFRDRGAIVAFRCLTLLMQVDRQLFQLCRAVITWLGEANPENRRSTRAVSAQRVLRCTKMQQAS
jgi:hypothetical protein